MSGELSTEHVRCPDCRGDGGYYGMPRGDDPSPWLVCGCIKRQNTPTQDGAR